jgi:hypothetical protein
MGALSSLATLGLDLALSRQAQKQDNRQLTLERDRQIRQIQVDALADRQKADALLKRRLAEQRARAGAAGIGSGGSADAVLRGLEEDSRAQQALRDAEDAAQLNAIRATFGTRQRRNLLELGSRWLDAGTRDLSGRSRRSLLD